MARTNLSLLIALILASCGCALPAGPPSPSPLLPADSPINRLSSDSVGEPSDLPPAISEQEAGDQPLRLLLQRPAAVPEQPAAELLAPPQLDTAEDGREVAPIDLATALTVATGSNPQVAFAQERIQEALADLEASQILWLPSLRAGLNYHTRSGNIQNTEGTILNNRRSALFTGLGSQAVGGGSVRVPGVWAEFQLADAVFEPRIAQHAASARRQRARATLNDMLLTVALSYLELLQALQELSIAQETLDHTLELVQITDGFAQAGLIPQADADRAHAEAAVRRNAVQRAGERLQVASARLLRWLSGEQSALLVPQEPTVFAIELVPPDLDDRQLVASGLVQRPELAEHQQLVAEALRRLQRERYAPLIPSVLLGATYGVLGGGQGSHLGDFDDRIDLDMAAWWEIRQLGYGERAARRAARSRAEQACWQQVQLMDLVAQEVTEAAIQVRFRREQIEVARDGLQRAIDSHRRNMQRIRQGEGLPLEAMQSIAALDQSRREYLRSIIEFNEAQFRLQRAVGWPIQ